MYQSGTDKPELGEHSDQSKPYLGTGTDEEELGEHSDRQRSSVNTPILKGRVEALCSSVSNQLKKYQNYAWSESVFIQP